MLGTTKLADWLRLRRVQWRQQWCGKLLGKLCDFLVGRRHYRYGVRQEADIFLSCFSSLSSYRIKHNFEEKFYEDHRVDAVAMERLTGSSSIINMYGFCGLTVVQEFAGRDLAEVIDSGKRSSFELLKLAKQIASGVADIHSIKGDNGEFPEFPSLCHNDLNPANLAFTADDQPKINDFNIAVLGMKHKITGEACPFYSHHLNPQWKAPEEQVEDEAEAENNPRIVDSKIDIYALGNVFFRMAAGASPWKRPGADRVEPDEKRMISLLKLYNGTMPTVPDAVLRSEDNDPALAALLEAMRLCYGFDPADRPTAMELVAFLDHAIGETKLLEQRVPVKSS